MTNLNSQIKDWSQETQAPWWDSGLMTSKTVSILQHTMKDSNSEFRKGTVQPKAVQGLIMIDLVESFVKNDVQMQTCYNEGVNWERKSHTGTPMPWFETIIFTIQHVLWSNVKFIKNFRTRVFAIISVIHQSRYYSKLRWLLNQYYFHFL